MCSAGSDWTCLQPGFPIRKSSDHSLVIDSPRLIADSYVLLRFLVPRHPPCALKNLSHKDARVHCSVLNIRSAPTTPWAPTTLIKQRGGSSHMAGPHHNPHHVGCRWPRGARVTTRNRNRVAVSPNPQDPTTCQAPQHPPCAFHHNPRAVRTNGPGRSCGAK